MQNIFKNCFDCIDKGFIGIFGVFIVAIKKRYLKVFRLFFKERPVIAIRVRTNAGAVFEGFYHCALVAAKLSWNPDDDVEALWREWAVPRHGANAEAVIAAMKSSEKAAVAAFSPLGLGAPTESFFANSAERRESLLRYTNRFFLPEGIAALAPTKENIARVVAEKDAAFAQLNGNGERFDWLRAQLKVARALDGALWRYFHLRACAKDGRLDADDFAGIEADFKTVRALCKNVCPGLGSPIPLMRDIRDKARHLQK